MGLLIVGLAGFGVVNGSGTSRSVASVGSEYVSLDDYGRALQQEQQAIQAQSGQSVSLPQLISFGVDRTVLNRLISTAVLDDEMSRIGLSIGDETLLEQISQISAFQDGSGQFDRNAYSFSLQNAGLSELEFEEDMRQEAARILAQGAIMSGAKMPTIMANTLTDYIGARRSFSYVSLAADDIALTQVAPTDTDLQTFYDENIAQFTLPESKEITYVALRPEMLLDTVEIDAQSLRDAYEARRDEYIVPDRRLVERLVFSDQDAAATAMAQLEVGGTTFETLVEQRGLSLSDVDLGDVARTQLGAAADGIFAAQVGETVGPLPSDLGPALYRVNGVLEGRETTFEQAEAELRSELAIDRARRVIEQRAEDIEDVMAGGATLEEVAADEELELGLISWTGESTDGMAAFDTFRNAANVVTEADFPTTAFLEDGSLFALRLNETLAARPNPFDQARDDVLAAYTQDRIAKALAEQADALRQQTSDNNGTFPETYTATVETGLRRTAYIDTAPVDLLNQVFEMEPGELRVVSDAQTALVVRLDDILPPAEDDEMARLSDALSTQLDQSIATQLLQTYLTALRDDATPRVNQHTIEAVHASFH